MLAVASAFEWCVVGGIALVAAASDVKTRRVPNALTLGAAAAALAVSGVSRGLGGVETSVMGWGTGLLLFFPFFALGGMGGGDVKLLAAIGAWLGPFGALQTALWGAIAGGVLALGVALWRGYLREAMRNIFAMVSVWRTVGPAPIPEMTLRDGTAPRIAYALPIAVGALVAMWLRTR
jgi:prepilin peptidase CpaA